MCSDPENARSRISLLYLRVGGLIRSGAALSPRRATHFSLLRQRNLRKRKATLLSASLRFATGNLRSRARTRFAQTIARPYPSGPPLLGAYRRGGVRIRIRGALSPLRGFNAATVLNIVSQFWGGTSNSNVKLQVSDCILKLRRVSQKFDTCTKTALHSVRANQPAAPEGFCCPE